MNPRPDRHPLGRFRFCPACGSSRFIINDSRSKRCADCGFVYYHNASAATVGVVVAPDGRWLVGRRALEPARGTLDLPGGFVDPGETLEEALSREIREETGLHLAPGPYLFSLTNVYVYSNMEIHTTDAFFLCPSSEIDVRPADDVAQLRWMRPDELRPEAFGLGSIRRGVARLLALWRAGRLDGLR